MGHDKKHPRVRVAAIIIEGDDILLARHERDDETYWVLPGGGVDFGESIGDALIRELKEEADLDIRLGHLIMVNDSVPPDKHRHIINLYFTAEIVGGKLKLGKDPRLAEMKFVPIAQLSKLTFYPDVRNELLAAIRNGYPNHATYLGNLWLEMS